MQVDHRRWVKWWAWLPILLASLAPQAADEEPSGVEERLRRLEARMESVLQENLELRRQVGLEPSAERPSGVVQSFARALELRLGGFVQVQGEFGDPGDARWQGTAANDRIYVRRARIETTGRFLEQFNFRLQGDYSGALGTESSQRFQMTDGWVNWNRYDFANLRAGQFFPVFGHELRLNPLESLTVELSLPAARLALTRQLGAQLNGDFFERRIGYTLGIFNGNGLNNNFNDNDSFMTVGQAYGVPWTGQWLGQAVRWRLALSGYHSRDAAVRLPSDFNLPGTTAFAGTRVGFAADSQLRIGPFDAWAEYLRLHLEPESAAGIPALEDYVAHGWTVRGGYYVFPQWQAILGYEEYDPTDQVPNNTTRAWTVGVNYWIRGSSLRASVNYLLMDVPQVDGWQQKVLMRMQAAF